MVIAPVLVVALASLAAVQGAVPHRSPAAAAQRHVDLDTLLQSLRAKLEAEQGTVSDRSPLPYSHKHIDVDAFLQKLRTSLEHKEGAASDRSPHPEVLERHPDIDLETPELIQKYGYPVEEHFVTTADGYILRMYRIPSSPKATYPSKYPILVMHGLESSAADWVVMGPDKAFAYILADAGYDVWLGNARGNKYSRNHTTLNPDKSDFWQFSWHEIGYFDLPAMIDYILDQTRRTDLFYAGHSQGTTSFYVMASTRSDYNAKIRVMFSLAPVAFMDNMASPLFQILAQFVEILSVLTQLIGLNEFNPNNEFMQLVTELMCSDGAFTQDICSNLMFMIGGFNEAEMNKTMLPVILSHTPGGASSKQFIHYGQEIKSGHFRQYDFGAFGNLQKYGSFWPPDYDLSKITAKVVLLYSSNDWLAAVKDVNRLYEKLPNCIFKFLVEQETFNHLDFLWAIHAKELVYDYVLHIMALNV
ncbi:lipase 3-like [Schistocerca americana]|uniref:lipase 3-like n=1 Tax=Schistocerca americana TaxID=7009 RepID=UPI001F4FD8D0|nr:lipase 3-like [Schistocerca americana]